MGPLLVCCVLLAAACYALLRRARARHVRGGRNEGQGRAPSHLHTGPSVTTLRLAPPLRPSLFPSMQRA